jgi:hypothetical protein
MRSAYMRTECTPNLFFGVVTRSVYPRSVYARGVVARSVGAPHGPYPVSAHPPTGAPHGVRLRTRTRRTRRATAARLRVSASGVHAAAACTPNLFLRKKKSNLSSFGSLPSCSSKALLLLALLPYFVWCCGAQQYGSKRASVLRLSIHFLYTSTLKYRS